MIAFPVLYPWPDKEPTYRGKRLSEYLYHLGGSGERVDDDMEAFVELGTNAIPYIRKALSVRDTQGRKALLWLSTKQSFLRIQIRPAVDTHIAALSAYKGVLEAVYEGKAEPSTAETCTNEVRALLNDPDPTTKGMAEEVLHLMGSVKLHAENKASAE